MSRAHVEDMLNRALGEMLSAPVVLDERGYALTRVNGVSINMEYDERREKLYLYASLGSLPEGASAAVCEAMLKADFMGADTGGGHIGLHGPTRILAYSLSLDMARPDARELANAFNLFVANVVEWADKVEELLDRPALSPEDSLFSGPMMGNVLWG